MAAPFSIQSIASLPKGAGTGTDNLTSLATANARGLGTVNQAATARADNYVHPIRIKSNASGTSSTGYARLYLITSGDGTVWTDGIDPDSTSNQLSKIASAHLVQAIAVAANATTYYFDAFSVYNELGFVPLYWAVLVDNESGAALSSTATDHYSKYSEIQFA